MNIIMNLKRKFKINGKESYSVEEMHHDIQEAREAFKKLMDPQVGSGHRINSAVTPKKVSLTARDTRKLMPCLKKSANYTKKF